MTTIKFILHTPAEARAFEAGVWFSELPLSTQLNGTNLAVYDNLRCESKEVTYEFNPKIFQKHALGRTVTVIRIRFPFDYEAQAFATGLNWYVGDVVNIHVQDSEVTIEQSRNIKHEDERIDYKYQYLRELMETYRKSTLDIRDGEAQGTNGYNNRGKDGCRRVAGKPS